MPLSSWGIDPVNIVMLYLLTVVLIAASLGRGPAVMSAFLAVGAFDFFHVPPHLSFAVTDVQYVLTFGVMLCVALLTGHLTTSLREGAAEARLSARRSEALANLARVLAGAPDAESVQRALDDFVRVHVHASALLLCPDPQEVLQPVPGAAWMPSATAMLAARALFRDNARSSVRLLDDQGPVMLLSLWGATRARGVLMLLHAGEGDWQPQPALLDALTPLASTALERQHYVEVAYRSQLEMVSERLRSSILSALSHDIRTPLTALYGQADAVLRSQPPLPGAAAEMVVSMRDQAWRLHHMVCKLLDMARLRSGHDGGAVSLRKEWQPLEEVIGASIQSLGEALAGHRVQVQLPDDLPLLSIDAVLMERVFGNLIENAVKYGPGDGVIGIQARVQGDVCEVCVRDHGPGFPAGRLEQVFELFERGAPESVIPGMGLGLTICRAIVQAHGGQIHAGNLPEGGAQVCFTLPLGSPPEVDPEVGLEVDA